MGEIDPLDLLARLRDDGSQRQVDGLAVGLQSRKHLRRQRIEHAIG